MSASRKFNAPIEPKAGIRVGSTDALFASGSHSVSSAEATAGSVAITTGFTSLNGFTVQVFDSSGVAKHGSDEVVTVSGGTITVADGAATFDLAQDDVVRWIAVGL